MTNATESREIQQRAARNRARAVAQRLARRAGERWIAAYLVGDDEAMDREQSRADHWRHVAARLALGREESACTEPGALLPRVLLDNCD